tara:strand:+ start:572 stop:853 length:282 start_codon:yes stop_codon:yes gene_type:complete
MSEKIVKTLSKEIDTIHGKTQKLTFSEPTGLELRKIGMPFIIKDGGIEINSDKVALYIEKCCGLGVNDANNLPLPDFVEAQNTVLGFFGQSEN